MDGLSTPSIQVGDRQKGGQRNATHPNRLTVCVYRVSVRPGQVFPSRVTDGHDHHGGRQGEHPLHTQHLCVYLCTYPLAGACGQCAAPHRRPERGVVLPQQCQVANPLMVDVVPSLVYGRHLQAGHRVGHVGCGGVLCRGGQEVPSRQVGTHAERESEGGGTVHLIPLICFSALC